jgi:hypothetical protein
MINHTKFLGYDKDENGNLIIDEKQAQVVRRIFTEYLEGKGTYRIAKDLEAEGVYHWDGKVQWYECSVRNMLSNEKYKGDALLQKTYTVDFLTKKRAENNGQVPQYYVENSHPAIIDKETWTAVQMERDRRKAFAAEHGIQKLEYATVKNPFAGRILCGCCGSIFGRKVWNSNDDRLRRFIWRCNSKYAVKGKKGCESKHIDDRFLYEVFIDAFNAVVENKGYFMEKWQQVMESEDDILKRVTAKRFIQIFSKAKLIDQFEMDLYIKLVEKIVVYDAGRLVVSLLDGSEIECAIE